MTTEAPKVVVFADTNGKILGVEDPHAEQCVMAAQDDNLPDEYKVNLPSECGGIFDTGVPCKKTTIVARRINPKVADRVRSELSPNLIPTSGDRIYPAIDAICNIANQTSVDAFAAALQRMSTLDQARVLLAISLQHPARFNAIIRMPEFQAARNILDNTRVVHDSNGSKTPILRASATDRAGAFFAMAHIPWLRGEQDRQSELGERCMEGHLWLDLATLKDADGRSYSYRIERSGRSCGIVVRRFDVTHLVNPSVPEEALASQEGYDDGGIKTQNIPEELSKDLPLRYEEEIPSAEEILETMRYAFQEYFTKEAPSEEVDQPNEPADLTLEQITNITLDKIKAILLDSKQIEGNGSTEGNTGQTSYDASTYYYMNNKNSR